MYYTLLDNLSFQMNFRLLQHSVCYPECLSIRFCTAAAGRSRQASATVLWAGDSGSLHHSIGDGSSSQREDSHGHFVELLHRAATEPQHVSSCRLCRLSRYHSIIDIDANTIPQQTCSDAAGCLAGGIRSPGVLVPQGTQYFPRGRGPIRTWRMRISGTWRASAAITRCKRI